MRARPGAIDDAVGYLACQMTGPSAWDRIGNMTLTSPHHVLYTETENSGEEISCGSELVLEPGIRPASWMLSILWKGWALA